MTKWKYSREDCCDEFKSVVRPSVLIDTYYINQDKFHHIIDKLLAKAPVKRELQEKKVKTNYNIDAFFQGMNEALAEMKLNATRLNKEHDEELIREGKSMSDRDTRRGV